MLSGAALRPHDLRQHIKRDTLISIFSRRAVKAAPGLPPVNGTASTKAVVFTAPRRVVYADVNMPELREFDARIQTLVSAISVGTERWALMGLRPDVTFPTIPGYLAVGKIVELGFRQNVDLQVGNTVVLWAGRQPPGFPNNWMCSHLAEQSISLNPAEYDKTADLPYCVKVPDEVSYEDAVFAGLGSVAKVGLDMIRVEPGLKAAVFGLGMVGQFSAQLLRNAGAEVSVIDLHPGRMHAAIQLGAGKAFSAGAQDFYHQVRQYVPDGFDIIVDTTGSAGAVNAAVLHLRSGGQFLFQGWYPGTPGLDLNAFHVKSARVFFPCGLTGAGVRYCLNEFATKRLSAAPLITHRFRPEESAGAYRLVLDNDPAALGLVFNWA